MNPQKEPSKESNHCWFLNQSPNKSIARQQGYATLILELEPILIDDAMEDDNRVKAMQEELDQFQKTMFGSL